jgi:hypothetical protein
MKEYHWSQIRAADVLENFLIRRVKGTVFNCPFDVKTCFLVSRGHQINSSPVRGRFIYDEKRLFLDYKISKMPRFKRVHIQYKTLKDKTSTTTKHRKLFFITIYRYTVQYNVQA